MYKINLGAANTASTSAPTSTPPSSSPSSTTSVPAPTESSPGTRREVPVPIMGESITQGVLSKWNKAVGDAVAAGEVVASIETDKVRLDNYFLCN
jgi:pyruvate dehydrogenase E2 component (dihydrolipoamide acetyltransferase)